MNLNINNTKCIILIDNKVQQSPFTFKYLRQPTFDTVHFIS